MAETLIHSDVIISMINDDGIKVTYKNNKVCILGYTEISGVDLDKIGLIFDDNLCQILNGYSTIDDYNILDCAIRLLDENSEYNVVDPTRWHYAGRLKLVSYIEEDVECYFVNLSNIPTFPKEKKIHFKLVDLATAFNKNNNALLQAMLLKLYMFKFRNILED